MIYDLQFTIYDLLCKIANKGFHTKTQRRKVFFLFFLLSIFYSLSSAAQEMVFSATASKTTVGQYEQFQLTFALKNASGKNMKLPNLIDFHILSGPNQSTSMQWINGNMSQSISYSYVLRPKAAGKFTIAPATVEVNGKTLQSNDLKIEVVQQQQQQTQKGNQQPQSAGNSEQDILNKLGENVFLRVTASKTDVFQGEQIMITYKIYTRVSIVNYELKKMPAFTGFWTQDVEMPRQIQLTQENLDGVTYNVGVLKKVIAFPQRAGTLEFDPMELETIVRLQSQSKRRSVWDDFFGGDPFGGYKDVRYAPKCNKLKINVRQFPENSKPENFGGAVGKFKMEAILDKTTTKTDEPITLKIKISGQGNIKLIEAPKLQLPPDIETYDPKIAENISSANNIISGTKSYDYLLIPRRAGEYKLPEFGFSYFDPEKKEYVSIASPSFIIQVEKGNQITTGTPTISGINKEDVKLIGQDIRFIKTKTSLRNRDDKFLGTPQFYVSVAMPFLLFFILFGIRQRQEKLAGNVALVKFRKANKMAKKRMETANKFLKENNKKNFYDETARALWGYLGDKLGISQADMTKDKVREILLTKNLSEEMIKQLLDTLDTCEMALFAPSSDSAGMEKIYQNAIELISKIEEQV